MLVKTELGERTVELTKAKIHIRELMDERNHLRHDLDRITDEACRLAVKKGSKDEGPEQVSGASQKLLAEKPSPSPAPTVLC